MEIITLEQSKRLIELEGKIDKHLTSFVVVCDALAEINRDELYKLNHNTFSAYCSERWKLSTDYARRLISAAKTAENIRKSLKISTPRGVFPEPTNENQLRPLSKIEPEKVVEVWKEAVVIAGGDQPTAKQVQQAVEIIAPSTKKKRVIEDGWKPLSYTAGLSVAEKAELADHLHAENKEMEAVLKNAFADDKAAANLALQRQIASLEGRLADVQRQFSAADKSARYSGAIIEKLRKLLNCGTGKLVDAVTALLEK